MTDNLQGAISPEQLSLAVDEFRREKAGTEDQRKEVSLLVKQAVAEAERATHRDREVSSQRHQMEADLEAFPRPEIRKRYSEVMESQMRLSTWRSQLEQLRSRQTSLEKTDDLLDKVLAVLEPMAKLWSSQASDLASMALPNQQEVVPGAALQAIELANHRLSRLLQDGPAQALSDLILRAEVCERLISMDPERAKQELAALRSVAAGALKSTRQYAYDLQPPGLEELGIVQGLERYIESSRVGEKLKVDLEVVGQEMPLSQAHAMALFRIVQEALANVAQHSGVDVAEVRIRFEPGQVVATVMDRGKGFEVLPTLARARLREHSGLVDMQRRAELIGGNVELSSKPVGGCMVSLIIRR